jgi:hypothetical protein
MIPISNTPRGHHEGQRMSAERRLCTEEHAGNRRCWSVHNEPNGCALGVDRGRSGDVAGGKDPCPSGRDDLNRVADSGLSHSPRRP